MLVREAKQEHSMDIMDPALRRLLLDVNEPGTVMSDLLLICNKCFLPIWNRAFSGCRGNRDLFKAFDELATHETTSTFSEHRHVVYVWLFREGDGKYDFGLYCGSTKDAADRMADYVKQFN